MWDGWGRDSRSLEADHDPTFIEPRIMLFAHRHNANTCSDQSTRVSVATSQAHHLWQHRYISHPFWNLPPIILIKLMQLHSEPSCSRRYLRNAAITQSATICMWRPIRMTEFFEHILKDSRT
ncbi:hypothetical protein GMOD_00010040 [Pyrenophora seminiperda CCB06]|uniref:Uncharacterized protein n=1 Tax=Pyrenophora seminiperda CCB06 TaxID=1302712 RepID=A0A3M7M1N9_9PLEO|nr:hypothetical protein GMOD_00010040 [Pyrenophora seminiperda CCB06]